MTTRRRTAYRYMCRASADSSLINCFVLDSTVVVVDFTRHLTACTLGIESTRGEYFTVFSAFQSCGLPRPGYCQMSWYHLFHLRLSMF